MTPNDHLLLHLAASFVGFVILPCVLVFVMMDVLLRRQHRLVFRAKLQAALDEGSGTISGPEELAERDANQDPWWIKKSKELALRFCIPCSIASMASSLIWENHTYVLGWIVAVSGLFGFWAFEGSRWQRALEWSIIFGLFAWAHYQPAVGQFFMTVGPLAILIPMAGSIVIHYTKEGIATARRPDLPPAAAALKRRYTWARMSLLAILVTWLGVYFMWVVWPALPPQARAAFLR